MRSKTKIVIYTAILGSFDELVSFDYDRDLFDIFCITDDSEAESDTFKIIKLPILNSNQIDPRMYKHLPHVFFPEYEASLWIDGRIAVIRDDLYPYLERKLNEADFTLFNHAHRDNYLQEAISCVQRNKSSLLSVAQQIDYYLKQGFDDSETLVETGVLLRRHMSPEVIKFQEAWWRQIRNFTHRDQLSFPYTANETKLRFGFFDDTVWENKYFKLLEHVK